MRLPQKTSGHIYSDMLNNSMSGGTAWHHAMYRRPMEGGSFISKLKGKFSDGLIDNIGPVLKTAAMDIGKDVLVNKRDIKSAVMSAIKRGGKRLVKKGVGNIFSIFKKKKKKKKPKKKRPVAGGKIKKGVASKRVKHLVGQKGGNRNRKLTLKSATSQKKVRSIFP